MRDARNPGYDGALPRSGSKPRETLGEAEAGAGERRKRNATKQRKADAERQRGKPGEELYEGRRKISALFFSDDLAGLRYDAGEDSLTFFFLRGCCLVGTVYDTTQREDPLTFFFLRGCF